MNTLLLTIIFFLLAGYAGLALLYFCNDPAPSTLPANHAISGVHPTMFR